MRHGAEDHGFEILYYLPFGLGFPAGGPEETPGGEEGRGHLAAQVAVLGVLAAQYFRPLDPKLPAHADVLVAGAREDKSYVLRFGLAGGSIEYPFTEKLFFRCRPQA